MLFRPFQGRLLTLETLRAQFGDPVAHRLLLCVIILRGRFSIGLALQEQRLLFVSSGLARRRRRPRFSQTRAPPGRPLTSAKGHELT